MEKLRPEKKLEYVAIGGTRCPYCGSDEIIAINEIETDGQDAWQDIQCPKCEHEWQDVYRLVAIETDDEIDDEA